MPTQRSRSRRAAAPFVVALAACAPLVHFPAPGAGVHRLVVEPGATSCTGGDCTHDVRVGEHRLRVVEGVHERSPAELRGRTAGTAARGAAGAMAGAIMRRNGFSTTHTHVGLGRRVVDDTAAALRLACDVAYIDEEQRERVSGEERSSVARLAEGWRCDVAPRGDSPAARWTLRGGIAPEPDSVAAVVALLERGEIGTATLDAPMRLARVAGAGPDGGAVYDVARAEAERARRGVIDVPAETWVVRRADGHVVGAVHHSALPRTVLDLSEAATAEEAAVLRLLAATIAVPLR